MAAAARQVAQILTLPSRAVLVAVRQEVQMLVRQGIRPLRRHRKAIQAVQVETVERVVVAVLMFQPELELPVLVNPVALEALAQHLRLLGLRLLMLVAVAVVREVMEPQGLEAQAVAERGMLVLLSQQILRAKPTQVAAVAAVALQPVQ